LKELESTMGDVMSVDLVRWVGDNPVQVNPDLLRVMVQTFDWLLEYRRWVEQALISAVATPVLTLSTSMRTLVTTVDSGR